MVFGHQPIDVFHHDDRSIHHHADGDDQAAQRHEIGGQPHLVHDDEGRQRRHDQCRRHHQGAAYVPQEQKQHDDHQHDAFEQRLVHRIERRGDQLQPVVKRHDPESVRQQMISVDLIDLMLDRLDDFAGIPAAQHEHDAGHGFPVTVHDGCPVTNRMPDLHIGHITHIDRRASDLLDDNECRCLRCS